MLDSILLPQEVAFLVALQNGANSTQAAFAAGYTRRQTPGLYLSICRRIAAAGGDPGPINALRRARNAKVRRFADLCLDGREARSATRHIDGNEIVRFR